MVVTKHSTIDQCIQTKKTFCFKMKQNMKDGFHLSGKGAAVFADGLSAAVDSGMGSISNIFGSKHYLN